MSTPLCSSELAYQWDMSGRRALVAARSAGPAVLRDDDGNVLGLVHG
jgi:hypothetical protein